MLFRRDTIFQRALALVNAPRALVPAALLLAVLLSYGLWIPWLGIYGNDVAYLYYYHLLGVWGPGEFASIDRPASALFYAISTALLGESVWPYHVFLLLLRWLSGVLLVWVLRMVWPERKTESAIAALLFVLYPGFRQMPIAVEFILHFAVLDLFLLSLGATLKLACGRMKSGWLAVSVLGAASLFWLEYFIGWEVLRPIFLWLVTRRAGMTGKLQWKRILLAWLPALVVVLAFVYWRVFVFSFPTYQPVLLNELRSSPLSGLVSLAKTAARDLLVVLAEAWRAVVALPRERALLPGFIALVLAGAALTALLLARLNRPDDRDPLPARLPGNRYWGEAFLGIGVITLLAGGLPFWVTGIPVTVEFPWDRSTLSFMLGASMVLVGLMEMAVTPRYRSLVVAALVGLAVGMHFINAYEYRQEWHKLQDFTWQLTWRVPGLEPGTLGLFDVIPLNRYSDNDLTSLLNWTYAPEHHDRRVPYKFFDLTLRLGMESAGLPRLEKALPVEHNHRGLFYSSNTSETLAVHYSPPGCLMVLSPEDASLPGLPERLAAALPMTDLAQVRTEGGARPPAVLGAEPEHGWCYFYQKAALARQKGDWATVADLGDEADAKGLEPAVPAERLPFIEGYARAGQFQKAQEWSALAAQDAALVPAVCMSWKSITQTSDLVDSSTAVMSELGCPP